MSRGPCTRFDPDCILASATRKEFMGCGVSDTAWLNNVPRKLKHQRCFGCGKRRNKLYFGLSNCSSNFLFFKLPSVDMAEAASNTGEAVSNTAEAATGETNSTRVTHFYEEKKVAETTACPNSSLPQCQPGATPTCQPSNHPTKLLTNLPRFQRSRSS